MSDLQYAQDYDDDDYGENGDCTMCGGEGEQPCHDPIQCTRRHTGNGWDLFCECAACGGSGRAEDQRIW